MSEGTHSNLTACVAIAISLVALILPFTPLPRFFYRTADISIVDRSDNVKVEYDPKPRKLKLSFQITVLNSGGRDGKLTGETARLTDMEEESSLVPFDSSDIQLAAVNQPSVRAIVIDKGDTEKIVTCTLDYQVSDMGLSVLSKPSTKTLAVRLKGGSRPLLVRYHLEGWTPNLLDSKSAAQRTLYEK